MRSTDSTPPPQPSDHPDDPTGLQQFAVLLRRQNSEFNRISQEFAQSQGLHLTDLQALVAILDERGGEEDGPMTPGRLRAHLNLTSGAMTACLDRLELAGHIRRVRAADDRRVVHLHYADAAKGVARASFKSLADATAATRTRFTPDELATVVRFLSDLNHELGRLRS